MLIYKEKVKHWHDARIAPKHIHEGQKVLVFNALLRLFPGKLKSKWMGPTTVVKVFPYGAIELLDDSGNIFKVNGNRVKPYRVDEILEKAKFNLQEVEAVEVSRNDCVQCLYQCMVQPWKRK